MAPGVNLSEVALRKDPFSGHLFVFRGRGANLIKIVFWDGSGLGETGSEPLPHPDDILINMQTGRPEIHGPMTKEEKVKWDRAREYKKEHDEFVEELEAMVKKRP